MPATMTSYDSLLKLHYEKSIQNQTGHVSDVAKLYTELPPKSSGGRNNVKAVLLSNAQSSASIGELGALPLSGNSVGGNLTFTTTNSYFSVQLSSRLMESSEADVDAFSDALSIELDSALETFKIEKARQLVGAGTGIKARVNGAVAAATVVNVDDPLGVTNTVGGAKFIAVGSRIAITDGVTIKGIRTVTARNAAGTQITLDAAITAADNDLIVSASTTAGTPAFADIGLNQELMGLLGQIDNGSYVATYFGISRAAFPIMQSHTDSVAEGLSFDKVHRACDAVWQKSGGERPDTFICGPEVQRAFIALTEAQRRYVGSSLLNPDGGNRATLKGTTLEVGGFPLMVDYFMPQNVFVGLTKKHCHKYVLTKGAWQNKSGSIWARAQGANGDIDAWKAYWGERENYANFRPNTGFRIENLTGISNIYIPVTAG